MVDSLGRKVKLRRAPLGKPSRDVNCRGRSLKRGKETLYLVAPDEFVVGVLSQDNEEREQNDTAVP